MKQEDKDLVLKYMSMALPYGVKAQVYGWDEEKGEIEVPLRVYSINTDGYVYFETNDYDVNYLAVDECLLYLRPMSSMTEEEDKERIRLGIWRNSQANGYEVTRIAPDTFEAFSSQPFRNTLNFLLENHFDIFGLIPKGLAIAVTEENNPYNTREE